MTPEAQKPQEACKVKAAFYGYIDRVTKTAKRCYLDARNIEFNKPECDCGNCPSIFDDKKEGLEISEKDAEISALNERVERLIAENRENIEYASNQSLKIVTKDARIKELEAENAKAKDALISIGECWNGGRESAYNAMEYAQGLALDTLETLNKGKA